MDMRKTFRKSTLKPGHAPQATIVYDKFHILRHLGEAMDRVRKQEYARLLDNDRRDIKGQKFVLLSNWMNLSQNKWMGLKELFRVHRRLCRANLLKESFGPALGLPQTGLGETVLRPVAGRSALAATLSLMLRSRLARKTCLLLLGQMLRHGAHHRDHVQGRTYVGFVDPQNLLLAGRIPQ